MRHAAGLALALVGASAASADEPLEKQFFDYFRHRCERAMQAEWSAANLDTSNPEAQAVIVKYCACTSQAVVSFLNAEEIISFAGNPEKEPAAGKMRPYFVKCQDRVRRKAGATEGETGE